MKRIGVLTIAVTMTVAACGGSNETVAEPDVEVEAVDDDGAFRLAGGDVQVINGCRIDAQTRCPRANLTGANLSEAPLERAWLDEANLRDANLSEADLYRAFLTGADLSGANLTGADLRYANLTGADLPGANLQGANLWDADLRYADLRAANLSGANLTRADLSNAFFCNTTMPNGSIRNDNC